MTEKTYTITVTEKELDKVICGLNELAKYTTKEYKEVPLENKYIRGLYEEYMKETDLALNKILKQKTNQ